MSPKLRVNNPILFLLSGALMLAPLSGLAATAVTVQDSSGNPTSCGDLVNLTTTPGQATIETDGTCIGSGGGTPTAVNINDIAVSDGSVTRTIDVSNYGVTVKLPFAVTSVTQPSLGSVSTPSGTSFTYTSPATVTGTQTTSFDYIIQDATADQATGTVNVTITHNEDPPPPPTGDCVPSSTLECKGVLSLTNVTHTGNSLIYGVTDVWEFTYNENRKGTIQHHHGNVKTAIISETPDENMNNAVAGAGCTVNPWYTEASLGFNEASRAGYYECPLVNGRTYYLKFKLYSTGTSDPDYYLVTNSSPQP